MLIAGKDAEACHDRSCPALGRTSGVQCFCSGPMLQHHMWSSQDPPRLAVGHSASLNHMRNSVTDRRVAGMYMAKHEEMQEQLCCPYPR